MSAIFRARAAAEVNSRRSWQVSHILRDLVQTRLVNEQATAVTVRNNYAFGHGSMVSFNTSQLFHDDSNGCWVPLELTFIASAVVTRIMRMRCYGHMAHGTSPLYTSVRSLRDLHGSLGPSALGCVNTRGVETCTSVYNLHLFPVVKIIIEYYYILFINSTHFCCFELFYTMI